MKQNREGHTVHRKILVTAATLLLLSSSSAHAFVIGQILKGLAMEAAKAASSEAGKSAVDYFKKLFNKEPTLAKEKQAPQLQDAGVSDKVRKWVISPAGTLSKSEIDEIARTLKGLDQNRDQTISTNISNRVEEISNTQIDNEKGVLINKADGPVTVNTQSGTQGNQTTIGDIRNNANTQVNINSPNATQNVNQKRTIQKQGRFERGMEGDTHVLNLIFSQTKGIWDPGEKFQVDIKLSGPFVDYRFLSGLPGAQFEVSENVDQVNGFIHYATRTPLINEPVIISIRSKSVLEIREIVISPLSEE